MNYIRKFNFVISVLILFLSGNYCKIIIEDDGVDVIDMLIETKSHTTPENEADYKIMELASTTKKHIIRNK